MNPPLIPAIGPHFFRHKSQATMPTPPQPKSYAEARKEAQDGTFGSSRLAAIRAFEADFPTEAAYLAHGPQPAAKSPDGLDAPGAKPALQTFAAFEGKIEGDKIKGVSIIQEGPALGHGVWIDGTTLTQVKALAEAESRLKSKLNHWSGVQDAVGYYTDFRIRAGKLLADLTLFGSHPGKDHLLQMIDEIPGSFGVSIMFQPGEPEYDKDNDRYNTRLKRLFSADFVDTPAANRDGVFSGALAASGNGQPLPAFYLRTNPSYIKTVCEQAGPPVLAKFEEALATAKASRGRGPSTEFDFKWGGRRNRLIVVATMPYGQGPLAPFVRAAIVSWVDSDENEKMVVGWIGKIRTAMNNRDERAADREIRALGSDDGFDTTLRWENGEPAIIETPDPAENIKRLQQLQDRQSGKTHLERMRAMHAAADSTMPS